jgi:hypothetical protein
MVKFSHPRRPPRRNPREGGDFSVESAKMAHIRGPKPPLFSLFPIPENQAQSRSIKANQGQSRLKKDFL